MTWNGKRTVIHNLTLDYSGNLFRPGFFTCPGKGWARMASPLSTILVCFCAFFVQCEVIPVASSNSRSILLLKAGSPVSEGTLLVCSLQPSSQRWRTDEDRCSGLGSNFDPRTGKGEACFASEVTGYTSLVSGTSFARMSLSSRVWKNKISVVDLLASGDVLSDQPSTDMGPVKPWRSRKSPLRPPPLALHSN